VSRDRRVLRVGQTHLHKSAARPTHRMRADGLLGKEPFDQNAQDLFARELRTQRTADQLGAAAGDYDRGTCDASVVEQKLFRAATGVREHAELPRIEHAPVDFHLLAYGVGEGEVHVVPAEQDMIADRDAMKGESALFFCDSDQR
jgi:hypothetical protein